MFAPYMLSFIPHGRGGSRKESVGRYEAIPGEMNVSQGLSGPARPSKHLGPPGLGETSCLSRVRVGCPNKHLRARRATRASEISDETRRIIMTGIYHGYSTVDIPRHQFCSPGPTPGVSSRKQEVSNTILLGTIKEFTRHWTLSYRFTSVWLA
ncbi:hypothetical protein ElyMa_002605000 [Elysia marginata]|uniref:Uncharacterized protein n=1 Tax=Elysia marginata TaxID=1093978 RepID=A0AAV4H188_9GAST|nr:hypothetical protein ElyMa_002605000 [Elysia marginata]